MTPLYSAGCCQKWSVMLVALGTSSRRQEQAANGEGRTEGIWELEGVRRGWFWQQWCIHAKSPLWTYLTKTGDQRLTGDHATKQPR